MKPTTTKMHPIEYLGILVISIGFILMLLPKFYSGTLPAIVDKYAFFTSFGLLIFALGRIYRIRRT